MGAKNFIYWQQQIWSETFDPHAGHVTYPLVNWVLGCSLLSMMLLLKLVLYPTPHPRPIYLLLFPDRNGKGFLAIDVHF